MASGGKSGRGGPGGREGHSAEGSVLLDLNLNVGARNDSVTTCEDRMKATCRRAEQGGLDGELDRSLQHEAPSHPRIRESPAACRCERRAWQARLLPEKVAVQQPTFSAREWSSSRTQATDPTKVGGPVTPRKPQTATMIGEPTRSANSLKKKAAGVNSLRAEREHGPF